MNGQCPFCEIVKGKSKAKVVYEDKEIIAFLDINPRARGHTVIITKKHYPTISDIPDKEYNALFMAVKKVCNKLSKNLEAEGFNIGTNSGAVAGQLISHAFVHVIPRFRTDDIQSGFESAFPVKQHLKIEADAILKEIEEGIPKEKKKKKKEYEKKHPHSINEDQMVEEWSFTTFEDVSD